MMKKLHMMEKIVLDAQGFAQSGDDFHTTPAEDEEAHARNRAAVHPCLFTKKACGVHSLLINR